MTNNDINLTEYLVSELDKSIELIDKANEILADDEPVKTNEEWETLGRIVFDAWRPLYRARKKLIEDESYN